MGYLNGTTRYFGVAKVIEETGEINQLLGKLIACPDEPHWDGKGYVKDRLPDEIADGLASLIYFLCNNYDDKVINKVKKRMNSKLKKYNKWELSGIMF